MDLPLGLRAKLFRQSLLAALHWRGEKAVRLRESAEGWRVEVDGREIAVASPQRWKLYRRGWAARLDRLAREYGVDRRVRLEAGAVVVDVGANAGEFAFVAATRGARVYCIEPDPTAFAALRANIETLRRQVPDARVALSDTVIWKEDGEIDFGLAPERADSSVFAGAAPTIRKPCRTLASFCAANAIDRVDLLKCDAEGAEPEVLEGAIPVLARIRAVALDTGAERMGARTHRECREILENHGFEVVDEKIGTRQMTFGVNRRGG